MLIFYCLLGFVQRQIYFPLMTCCYNPACIKKTEKFFLSYLWEVSLRIQYTDFCSYRYIYNHGKLGLTCIICKRCIIHDVEFRNRGSVIIGPLGEGGISLFIEEQDNMASESKTKTSLSIVYVFLKVRENYST